MKDRLLQLLTSENMTALKFAEIMEIRPSNVSHILSGRNNPNFDFIARLLRRFPELSPDWVLNGVGDMYRVGFKHDFNGMGDEGADETAAAKTLFSDDAPAAISEAFVNPVPTDFVAPVEAASLPLTDFNSATDAQPAPGGPIAPGNVNPQVEPIVAPATHRIAQLGAINDENAHFEQSGSAPAQNNSERIVASDSQQAQKLVIIYADNTFEVLTPKPR